MQEAHTDREGKVIHDTGKETEVPENINAMAYPLTAHSYVASEHTTQLSKKLSLCQLLTMSVCQLVQGDKQVKK